MSGLSPLMIANPHRGTMMVIRYPGETWNTIYFFVPLTRTNYIERLKMCPCTRFTLPSHSVVDRLHNLFRGMLLHGCFT